MSRQIWQHYVVYLPTPHVPGSLDLDTAGEGLRAADPRDAKGLPYCKLHLLGLCKAGANCKRSHAKVPKQLWETHDVVFVQRRPGGQPGGANK